MYKQKSNHQMPKQTTQLKQPTNPKPIKLNNTTRKHQQPTPSELKQPNAPKFKTQTQSKRINPKQQDSTPGNSTLNLYLHPKNNPYKWTSQLSRTSI